ncbi:MAG: spike base protein, RCAP_Rcc01079 family [Plesiomonas shigelloides]
MPSNPFKGLESNPNGLIRNWVAVTPNDSTNNVGTGNVAVGLWITGAGDVSWIDVDGNTTTVTGIAAGTMLPGSFARVRSTGTTATGIFALISV